jgi:hypothetical protein
VPNTPKLGIKRCLPGMAIGQREPHKGSCWDNSDGALRFRTEDGARFLQGDDASRAEAINDITEATLLV